MRVMEYPILPQDKTNWKRASHMFQFTTSTRDHFPNLALKILRESIVPAFEASENESEWESRLNMYGNANFIIINNQLSIINNNHFYNRIIDAMLPRDPTPEYLEGLMPFFEKWLSFDYLPSLQKVFDVVPLEKKYAKPHFTFIFCSLY